VESELLELRSRTTGDRRRAGATSRPSARWSWRSVQSPWRWRPGGCSSDLPVVGW